MKLIDNSKEHGYATLYKMFKPELVELKKYLKFNLRKSFIKPSTVVNASPVMFVRKSSGELKFCVDYRKLNDITKKEKYSMLFINDILDRIIEVKYLTV